MSLGIKTVSIMAVSIICLIVTFSITVTKTLSIIYSVAFFNATLNGIILNVVILSVVALSNICM
jgi:hypothetical protein